MRERYASEEIRQETQKTFQWLLDALAKEYKKPSEDFYDKKINEGYSVGMLVAGQKVLEMAKRLGVEGLKIGQDLQDHLEWVEEYKEKK